MIQDSGLVSALFLPRPEYPSGRDGFSPSEDYPEAVFSHRGSAPNPVYAAVRDLLIQAGLDQARLGTPAWDPLGEFVRPGGRVFVLCNFVYHRLPDESELAFQGKCTHASVLRPLIDYALKAVGPEGRVEFGNAPLQSGDWERILHQTECDRLLAYYREHAPGRVAAVDLRSQIVVRSRLGAQGPPARRTDNYFLVDLAAESRLEGAGHNGRYRVLQYDPRQTMEYHRPGAHLYALNSVIAAADLVISVPKLKTHEKVGITGALKGCVGAAALKQCLAHHCQGAPVAGGDEYPNPRRYKDLLDRLSDWTWTRPEGWRANLGRISEKVALALIKRQGGIVGGAWPGNDTCWRMSLDITRCVLHTDPTGRLQPGFQRPFLVLTDGVIGGEGHGPLKPRPVPTGWLAFATDPFAADFVNCRAMGFDPMRLPLIRNAAGLSAWPITGLDPASIRIRIDGRDLPAAQWEAPSGRSYTPPPAWYGTVEIRSGCR